MMSSIPEDDIKRKKRLAIFQEDDGREKFNTLVGEGKIPHLQYQNLANLDLRGYDLLNMDLTGSYMHGTNLTGMDIRGANLSGTSLKDAKVSGCYFPKDLPADEIRLSLEFGTRVRHR